MNILKSLSELSNRLSKNSDDATAPFGYGQRKISYGIVLSTHGSIVQVIPLLEKQKSKFVPKSETVPLLTKTRTSGLVSNFLWDKTEYSLGVSLKNPDGLHQDEDTNIQERITYTDRQNDCFRVFHSSILEDVEDEGLKVFRSFVKRWNPESFCELPNATEMLGTNVVFRVDGEPNWIHEKDASIELWANYLRAESTATKQVCLVSGEVSSIADTHPLIKGVRGSQSSGAAIVSFNKEAFESYGKKQGSNAPTSNEIVIKYTQALNSRLASKRSPPIHLGNTTVTYWAESRQNSAEASFVENVFSTLMFTSPKETEAEIEEKLQYFVKGQPIQDVFHQIRGDTSFYILGLSPNSARLSIRFWFEDSIGNFTERLRKHWEDLAIEPDPWQGNRPTAKMLLQETAVMRDPKNILPKLEGDLFTAILTGSAYPQSLLANIVLRMRADKTISGRRASICKAVLNRVSRLKYNTEVITMALNKKETNLAYRAGRLFAIFEHIQAKALGTHVNTTIREKYFGAASAVPASVFPLLERYSVHHLSTIRKNHGSGLARWFENHVNEIYLNFPSEYPKSFDLSEQGRFAIGYHHQAQAMGAKRDSDVDQDAKDEK